jgi:uncharacterized protein YegL
MNWLPHLLSPGAAAIAGAVALPSLLVLYFLKLRRREMPVSSTFLWRKAVQDLQVNAPFQRLRRNLLLILQMLALLALIAALARPVANYTPGAAKLSVILIDRSASMGANDMPNGKTRLDDAKRQAIDLVDGLERGGVASVIAFDDSAEVVQTFTSDTQLLRNAINSVQQTDRATKLKQAFQLAGAQAAHIPEQNRANIKPSVYLFSDGRVEDGSELNLDGDLKYLPIGTDAAQNIAIVSLDAKRNYDNPVQVQVFARLADYGAAPIAADVRLTVDGVVKKVAGVKLTPERWADPDWVKGHPGEAGAISGANSVEFTVDMTAAGVVRVEQMATAGDALAADDAAAVVVPPPKTLSVLLVTAAHDDPFLELAFSSQGLSNAQTMLAEDYEDKQPKNFDVIIFDRYTPQWMPPSGSYIWFGCAPPKGKLHVVKTGERYDTVNDVSVLDWQRDHPILRHLQVGDLYAATMLKLAVPPDAQVLVDGIKGPMIVLDREVVKEGEHDVRSTNLVVAFDLLQSNWPLHKVSFPLFIHYALQYLALGSEMAVRASYQPGATPRLPRSAVDQLGSDVHELRVSGPGGPTMTVPIPASGDLVLPAMNHVGIYRTEPPVPGFEQLAVNLLDPSESNLVPIATPPGDVTTSANATLTAAAGKGRLELWRWLVACGAVPVLLVEWWVYTRRVHL